MGTPDMRGTFGTFTFYTDDPVETTRTVPGGRIVRVPMVADTAELELEGPENTLRNDRRPTAVTLRVERDPSAPIARFATGDTEFILRQGEWSDWIRVAFPLLPGMKSAAGIFRVYAKELQPRLRIYTTPVNLDPAAPELPLSTPDSYSRELAATVGSFYTQGIAEDTAALRAAVFTREEYRVQSRLVADEQFALLRHALERFDRGLLFFHFLGIDQDSHMLWGDYEQELLETYKRVDREVGRVVEHSRGATVIVISDHGFAHFDRAVNLNTWLWREGFLALDNPFNTSNQASFPHVDWSRTQAYALGLNAIYLNVKGREQNGIVEPGAQSDRVASNIAERLRSFHDPVSRRRVVAAVYLPREAYRREPVQPAPDLLVGYAAGYRASWQTGLGAVPMDLIEDNREEWRGDHCIAAELVPGVFVSNRAVRIADPRLADITVTLLAEFGVKPKEGMEGRALF
jgi:predicted AlkP superfamily phosphohydrolase/phosphomutase